MLSVRGRQVLRLHPDDAARLVEARDDGLGGTAAAAAATLRLGGFPGQTEQHVAVAAVLARVGAGRLLGLDPLQNGQLPEHGTSVSRVRGMSTRARNDGLERALDK